MIGTWIAWNKWKVVRIAAAAVLVAAALYLLSPATAFAGDCQAEHTVKRGETLWAIGRFYGVDWTGIATENTLANPNLIFPGQEFCIPEGTAPVSGGASAGASSGSGGVSSGASTVAPLVPVPTFSIVSVIEDGKVEIRTSNYPAGVSFRVRMGLMGTRGINGTLVKTIDSGSGGSFTTTFDIPASLNGQDRIAIRLESDAGYFSYNWFYNNTTP